MVQDIFGKHAGRLAVEDCAKYFHHFIRAPADALIGLEYEMILMDDSTCLPIPYFGPRGLAELLRLMMADGYHPHFDNGLIIGLQKGETLVSLEPGGQLEFSSSAQPGIGAVRDELWTFLRTLDLACRTLAIRWLPIGYRPIGHVDTVPTVPRTRYLHMMPILEKAAGGAMGQKMTASMQVSVDYFSATHAGKLLRLGLLIQPYVVAACANSPFGPSTVRCKSQRINAWRNFDSRRCDVPEFLLQNIDLSETFIHYANWAMDKQLLFLQRNGQYLTPSNLQFKSYLMHGFDSCTAESRDWALHLGTLYPHARLKNVVKFRAADTCDPALAIALMALWKGLVYCEAALDAALAFAGSLTAAALMQLYNEAAMQGLAGKDIHGMTFAAGIQVLLEIAESGLPEHERACLEPFRTSARACASPADHLLRMPPFPETQSHT